MSQKNKLRFYHTTDLDSDRSTWRQVFPVGSKKYEWKKDKDRIFYRKSKKDGYTFINSLSQGIEDFNFFNNIDKDVEQRCATRYIITERRCNGVWSQDHVGKFTMNNGVFDLDRCTINVKQDIVDPYSCLEENKKEKFNILSVDPVVNTFSPILNDFEFSTCRNKEFLADSENKPCDATRGWRKFYKKTALNSSEPRETIYLNNTGDLYSNGMQTKDHAAWIKFDSGIYSLEIFRFSDNSILEINFLDADSSAVNDNKTFCFTSNSKRDLHTYSPDTNLLVPIVRGHNADIIWFDCDGTLGREYAFYYDGSAMYARDNSTGITRIVDSTAISTDSSPTNNILSVSYGDGLLSYHSSISKELKRYDPSNFTLRTVESVDDLSYLQSESGYLTWFNADNGNYNLQNIEDSSFTIKTLRNLSGNCRYSARSKEWLVFDDESDLGKQLAYNLISEVPFIVTNNVPGATIQENIVYKIENGWFMQAAYSPTGVLEANYLDSWDGSASNFYRIDPLIGSVLISGTPRPIISMSAGVERIFISAKSNSGSFPRPYEIWSIDIKDGSTDLVESLGLESDPSLQCKQILMNNYEQVLTITDKRIHIYKENIQRNDEMQIWFRKKTTNICVGGDPVSPGTGWLLLNNRCEDVGVSTWVKEPISSEVPDPSDILMGGCLCTDEEIDLSPDPDECVSLDPNGVVTTITVLPDINFNSGTIIGPIDGKQAFGGAPKDVTFYIEKPRDSSVYTWTAPSGASILSGQGTDVVVITFNSTAGLTQVTCQETNACSVSSIPLISHPFTYVAWNNPATSATTSVPVYVEVDSYSGAVITFTRAFNNPWPGAGNIITGESSSSFSTDSKNRTVLTVTHDGVSGSVAWFGSIGGASFNSACNIVPIPSASEIVTPNEVCPVGIQTYNIKSPRVGCSYVWEVEAPCSIVGSNTGNSVQIDMNGAAGTEILKVDEVCPIGQLNYQLISPCNELHSDSWWWIVGKDINYTNGRLLKNVVEGLIANICPDIKTVRSDFFQWNPINPSSINYVYNGVNQYNYLMIFQKSDVVNPNLSQKASIGEITFEQLEEWFRNIEVYYQLIDDEIHFEHISRLKGVVGLDLTQEKHLSLSKNQNKFRYAKEEMSRKEEYTFMESKNADFVGFDIEYRDQDGNYSLCVNEQSETRNFEELTTDLSFIQSDAVKISLEGFVILANTFNGTDYDVIQDVGLITQVNQLNTPMSIATLQDRFMRHNRILGFGTINRRYTLFESTIFFKNQDKFKIILCCDENFNPLNLVKTLIGNGEVDTAEIDYKDDTLDIKLKYE